MVWAEQAKWNLLVKLCENPIQNQWLLKTIAITSTHGVRSNILNNSPSQCKPAENYLGYRCRRKKNLKFGTERKGVTAELLAGSLQITISHLTRDRERG